MKKKKNKAPVKVDKKQDLTQEKIPEIKPREKSEVIIVDPKESSIQEKHKKKEKRKKIKYKLKVKKKMN